MNNPNINIKTEQKKINMNKYFIDCTTIANKFKINIIYNIN